MKRPERKTSELNDFVSKYRNGLERRYKALESATPTHPETGKTGRFVGFLRNYPIYRTEEGDEMILGKGVAKSLVRR